ncbi:PREDICTED: peptidyl-prolyl cis-trans isomerase FKBP14 [Mesitornis unicolor]|nr:PREDICTED: peptidyl-prolyl cis-trans isomerase FKBP14 [Mesitornis unicolor]
MGGCFFLARSEASQSKGVPLTLDRRKLEIVRCEGCCHVCWTRERCSAPGPALATAAVREYGMMARQRVEVEVLQKPFICHRRTKWGDMMLVHYEGYLERDGSMFHSTHKHNNGQPMWFTLGIREAIKGWDKGLKDMCVGEKRKLTVPPALAYGKEGKGKIPPESTLIFNIDLLEIRNGPRSHESFQEMDLNDDWKLSKQEVKIYLKKEFERHGAVVNDTQHDALVEDIFDKEDEDSDGFISAREFTYKHDEL